MNTFRISCTIAALLIPALAQENLQGHRSGLTARVISADGTSRTVRLQGVGCSLSICSRVFIRSTDEAGAPQQTWLDSIRSIRRTDGNNALLELRDGIERRVALLPDFRVLYVSGPDAGAAKVDLGEIQSLKFIFKSGTGN
jgi:hypothetical protein